MGIGAIDPDSYSPTLQEYHRLLWSKELPNGEMMDLKKGKGTEYLTWKDFRFGSDTIIVDFRYQKYREMHEQVKRIVPDYKAFVESNVRRAYTIGGTIIFPKHVNSMNQRKGTNRMISDRWDYTLECIRRYYVQEESPLSKVIERDKDFFDLFVDFKGYVDYFLLQDCVTDDYRAVTFCEGNGDFTEDGLPKTLEAYMSFLDKEYAFLEKRNQRIREYARNRWGA